MKILEYIQSESDRQSATLEETIGMVDAWKYVRDFGRDLNVFTVIHIAKLITGVDGFRTVPAVFNQGRPAVKAELVTNCMLHWVIWVNESSIRVHSQELDAVMKEFLDIHPFADGNGRVASLLYNHYRGTILDPIPLPYYFGEAP